MARAIIVTPNGVVCEKEMPKGDNLQWLYKEIGCTTVDLVRLDGDLDMWIDDGQGVLDKGVNPLATAFLSGYGALRSVIYGTVILAKHDGRGGTIGLTHHELDAIETTLEGWRPRLEAGGFLEAVE